MRPYIRIFVLMFALTGSLMFVIRMTNGGELPTDDPALHKAQVAMEWMCALILILMAIDWVKNLRHVNAMRAITWGLYILLCVVATFLLPEDIQKDPSKMRQWMLLIIMIAMIVAMALAPRIEKRIRARKHPDGFFLSFGEAFRIAKNGGRCVCETGNCMGPPLGEGSPGPVRLKWPVTAQELGARWREIDEDQTDDQRREGGHHEQDRRCPDDCRGPGHHAIIVQDGPRGWRDIRGDLREM